MRVDASLSACFMLFVSLITRPAWVLYTGDPATEVDKVE